LNLLTNVFFKLFSDAYNPALPILLTPYVIAFLAVVKLAVPPSDITNRIASAIP
jgi:hypothetical protein